MRLIVNADDLGMDASVNDAVFDLMARGRVTSATIMANGPAVMGALPGVLRSQGRSFGVHLNLTEYRPLGPVDRLRPILYTDGQFAGNVESTRMTLRLLRAIYEEFCAQIEFLLRHGVKISHIDSHQHVHTLPQVFPAVKWLQRRFGIGKVRISRTIPAGGGNYRGVVWLKKRAYNLLLRHGPRTTTTDGFADLQTFHGWGRQGGIRAESFEVMVHPGSQPEETELLREQWEGDLPFQVSFINYHEL